MCAYPTDQTNQTARWSHIQDIIDVLQGTTADRIQIIQYNNSSYYAGDFRNLDTTNSYGLRVRDASNNNLLLVYKNNLALGASAANDALAINANISGKVYIGDSANGDMTVGLTINQGANDNEILTLKSSDVAHGATSLTETDTYGCLLKTAAASGGLTVEGYLAAAAATSVAIQIGGYSGTNADTTKSTAGRGLVEVFASQLTGTSYNNVVSNGNLFAVLGRSGGNNLTRLIVDAEGHIHSIGATATDMLGNGLWFLNDTANTFMTLGLTINQGANDNEILAFKSSDVDHGMLTLTETDTYGLMRKVTLYSGANGGLQIDGYSNANIALYLLAGAATAPDTTKDGTAHGAILLAAGLKSGTSTTTVGANGNLLVLRNNTTTRFILDGDGDSHQDVGTAWTEFDVYDDVALLDTLSGTIARRYDPVKREFASFLAEHRNSLATARIVTFNDDGHHFINWSRANMLVIGAIRQMAARLALAESRLAALPASAKAAE